MHLRPRTSRPPSRRRSRWRRHRRPFAAAAVGAAAPGPTSMATAARPASLCPASDLAGARDARHGQMSRTAPRGRRAGDQAWWPRTPQACSGAARREAGTAAGDAIRHGARLGRLRSRRPRRPRDRRPARSREAPPRSRARSTSCTDRRWPHGDRRPTRSGRARRVPRPATASESLTAGDFDGDGYADLACVPGEGLRNGRAAMVMIIRSASGLVCRAPRAHASTPAYLADLRQGSTPLPRHPMAMHPLARWVCRPAGRAAMIRCGHSSTARPPSSWHGAGARDRGSQLWTQDFTDGRHPGGGRLVRVELGHRGPCDATSGLASAPGSRRGQRRIAGA